VPIFLGIVTLAVSLASWRVAHALHELSLAVGVERDRADLAARKLVLADRVYQWDAGRWTDKAPDISELARRQAELGRLSVALTESKLPGAQTLQSHLWELDHARHAKKPKLEAHAEISKVISAELLPPS
jgi:hypothetical protein